MGGIGRALFSISSLLLLQILYLEMKQENGDIFSLSLSLCRAESEQQRAPLIEMNRAVCTFVASKALLIDWIGKAFPITHVFFCLSDW